MRPDARNLNEVVESFETHTLDPGQKKYTVEYDPLDERSATFTFNREDETLGNLLRSALLASDHVLFCATKTEHPLMYKITLRVTTDETTNPEEAVVTCSKRLIEELNALSLRFTREWEFAKMAARIGSQTPEYEKENDDTVFAEEGMEEGGMEGEGMEEGMEEEGESFAEF